MLGNFIFGFILAGLSIPAFAQIEVATFENLSLPDNSYWCGELDEEDEDLGFGYSWFDSGSFEFNNFYWPEYSTWSFFAYSSRTEKIFGSYQNDQFNSITGGGADGSRIFAVAFPASYMGSTIMDIGDGETPVVIPGMQIVNTSWVVDCIHKGDGYEGPFKTGDWMKLILTGMLHDEATKVQEYYLADYRSENVAEHYYLDEWTWIDLSCLGEVTAIKFDIDSSKKNAYGVTTPTYVCIDNVGIESTESSISSLSKEDMGIRFAASTRTVYVTSGKGSAQYYVTDMTGKQVMTGKLMRNKDSFELSSLGQGIYIITLLGEKGSQSLKVVL